MDGRQKFTTKPAKFFFFFFTKLPSNCVYYTVAWHSVDMVKYLTPKRRDHRYAKNALVSSVNFPALHILWITTQHN